MIKDGSGRVSPLLYGGKLKYRYTVRSQQNLSLKQNQPNAQNYMRDEQNTR